MSWGDAAGHGVGAGGELTLAEETFVQGLVGLAFQAGDLLYHNGTILTRLPIGTSGQALTVSGGLPAWGAASGGVSDHGDLTGLTDDDHTQYALNTHSYVTVSAEGRFTAERVLTGTSNQITITDGGAGSTVTLSTPQDIATSSSPTFAGATFSGLTATRLLATDGSKALASVADLTSWIAGTANQITVTSDGDGTVTLSTPQDIATASSPQFAGINVGHATDTTVTRSSAGVLAVEGNIIYHAGGTDVTLADGGTGASLADPNDDRVFMWDDSAGSTVLTDLGTGLTTNATPQVLVDQTTAFAWTGAHTHTVAGVTKTSTNSTDGASVQVAIFEGDRATTADNDEAYLTLRLSNDGGTQTEFARLTWVATDVNAGTSVDGRIDFAVVTAGSLADEMQLDGTALAPSTTDGLQLGTSALNWADLFLDLGAVINFDSGDVTITHSANALDIDGGVVDFGSVPTVNSSAIARAADKLSFFAATTSAELAGVISDETGSGLLVFGTAPVFASTITVGTAGGTTGAINIRGTTSGTAVITVPAVAGTPTYVLPAAVGGAGTFLKDAAGDGILSWSTPAGSGDVSKVGTPVNNQIGVWTGDGTIEGDPDFLWDGSILTMTNTTDAASVQSAIIQGDRATMAANDEAYLSLKLSDSAGNQDEFARLTWVGTDVTSTSEDGRIDFATVVAGTLADRLFINGTSIGPSTTDAISLGTSTLNFSDLFLDSGAVINFDSGNVTLTHAAGALTLAGGTLTLAENTSIALDPAGSADGKYSGITVTGTAGATLAFGDLIYLDPTDSRWELADANAAAAADGDARGILGICVLAAAADGNATTILLQGIVRADAAFPAMTIGAPVYVSETAGDVVVTQPTTTDVVIRIVGIAITADEMFFNPDNTWATHT